jgi:hypothetical protein
MVIKTCTLYGWNGYRLIGYNLDNDYNYNDATTSSCQWLSQVVISRVQLLVVTAHNLDKMGTCSDCQNNKVENRELTGKRCHNANNAAIDAVHHENALLSLYKSRFY